MKLASTKVVQDRANLLMEKRKHMLAQMMCRNLYYSWKQKACCEPSKYVCIIHDKMDQVKTYILRLEPHPKSLSRVMQLPISLTGMLVHGHKKIAYGLVVQHTTRACPECPSPDPPSILVAFISQSSTFECTLLKSENLAI